ncbi:16S rRNA (cytosine(967)-C(5))-methyltransferase RsmB [Paenibacillus spiritus]|uniref:16S rRNA (cytosine(967)-C(5))-methyltransferase n=1 Tax=Paenibacillus spiritus TaxID=2496557 RepID=A0A5J5G8Y8_9BACL|nr:16S rRNA (cytosine(967)-C(5))-methyltransferase RsmB [Paenibacillus spiritus]KAA9004061.1 16S rRNA (cytosine(967)-C(5))-methyltransferase RsmB [Paenibacillus spiritus]
MTPSERRSGAAGRSGREATARSVALDVLIRVEANGAYSNLQLNSSLQKAGLSREDAGLTTELVYGTISRLNTLDYILAGFVKKGLSKLEPWVRCLLRMSLYQLVYLDRVPPHAAVNEAVRLAKQRGHQGISGMVNGVLRSAQRAGRLPVLPDDAGEALRIALTHSHPEWMVREWMEQYGAETAEAICRANNEPPAVSVRVNTTMTTRERLLDEMKREGLDASASAVSPYGIVVRGGGNLALTSWYKDGLLSIQDESSMLVAEAVAPEPGMNVLDCCSAPGGKTSHLAELMLDRGRVVACDLHSHKTELVRDQAARLGLEAVETRAADALRLGESYAEGTFDRILLDAPCSGLGVIRRKPDLKWTKTPEDTAAIAELQRGLLDAVCRLLKPGGLLVYSTCTIESSENEEQVRRFLDRHPDFEAADRGSRLASRMEDKLRCDAPGLQILPQDYGSDGFYIAVLKRKAE